MPDISRNKFNGHGLLSSAVHLVGLETAVDLSLFQQDTDKVNIQFSEGTSFQYTLSLPEDTAIIIFG